VLVESHYENKEVIQYTLLGAKSLVLASLIHMHKTYVPQRDIECASDMIQGPTQHSHSIDIQITKSLLLTSTRARPRQVERGGTKTCL
jgi:hypothetical protein